MILRTRTHAGLLALLTVSMAAPGAWAQLSSQGNQFWTQESTGISGSSDPAEFMGTATVAGDFNNDGFADLAIGIPLEVVSFSIVQGGVPTTLTAQSGRVVVIYGSADGLGQTNQSSQSFSKGAMGVPGAPADGDLFGFAMAAGDFNGDGFTDLAVSAPFGGDAANSVPAGGEVIVLPGSPGGLTSAGSQIWIQGANELLGENELDDGFGAELESADFNNDGFADLAVGIPMEDVGTPPLLDAGAVAILFGSAGGLGAPGNQFWTENELQAGSAAVDGLFGTALAAGDFNNDGFVDLVASAPGRGPLWALSFSAAGLTTGVQVGITGSARALASGDFNNDGFADLAAGFPEALNADAPQTQGGLRRGGMVGTLFGSASGLTLGQIFGVESSGPGDFGTALVAADFNNDGFDDLAGSVPLDDVSPDPASVKASGSVVVIGGNAARNLATTTDFQVFQQGIAGILDTSEADDQAGGGGSGLFEDTLASGDFNGDGFPDLAIGVPFEDREDPDVGVIVNSGAVNVLYGGRDFSGDLQQALQDLQGVVNQLNAIPVP